MHNKDERNAVDKKSGLSVVNYASYLILMAIFTTLCTAFIYFMRGKPWSLGLLMNILTQGLGYLIIYVILAIYIKKKYAVSIKPIHKKLRIPTIVALLLTVIFIIAIFLGHAPKGAMPLLMTEIKDLQTDYS